MKKTLILGILLLTTGCQDSYRTKLNEHEMKMQGWQARFGEHKVEVGLLDKQENAFIETLTDEKLAYYELAVQAFRSGIQTSREIARRNLQANMNETEYQLAMELLNDRVQICNETSMLGSQIETLGQEAESLANWNERRREAVSDYMLRETIRSTQYQY